MLKLTEVQGYEVMLKKPMYLSDEPTIMLVKDGIQKPMTVHSLEYENETNEFMLKGSLDNEIYPVALEAMEELAKDTVQLSYFLKFTVKDKYKEMIDNYLD